MLGRRLNQRGDTIIEVMVAFAVFAMLAIGAMTIMNRGVSSAQQSLEMTLVRQQMDGQAEALRYLHQAYVADSEASGPSAVFRDGIMAPDTSNPGEYVYMVDNASQFGGTEGCSTEVPGHGFMVDTTHIDTVGSAIISGSSLHNMDDSTAPAFPQLTSSDAYGMWVEAVKSESVVPSSAGTTYIDFHIRACWYSPTGEQPITLGTIVRLYVPAA